MLAISCKSLVILARVVIDLGSPRLQQVQDDFHIFGNVVVPGGVEGIASARDGDGGNRGKREPVSLKELGQRMVIITRDLEGYAAMIAALARRAPNLTKSDRVLEKRKWRRCPP